MEIANLQEVLRKFVQQISGDAQPDRPLTINDLRLSIRGIRLSEIREWSNRQLDLIETHADRFESDAPLECVMSFPGKDSR